MSGGTVVVRGRAVVPGEPDELEVSLTLSAVHETAAGALAEAGRLSASLSAVLIELDVADIMRTVSGVSVREEFERIEGRWVRRGYRASNRVVVRLAEPDRVARLMSEAASRARARVDGPRWRFKPENPARAEACRQAAADAQHKAEAYASALGLRLGAVLKVVEPGTDHAAGGPLAHSPTDSVYGPTDMQLQGGHLDLEATVEVTFALTPGPVP